jgi:hypothetical protein
VSDNIEHKIRALEALALRPGTPAEGDLAKQRAIELSQKHGVRSIFTDPTYKPVSRPKPKVAPKLHPIVVALDNYLRREGWIFSGFGKGMRIYKNASRPDEEIHMTAHGFSQFTCQHLYIPSGHYRQAGNNPEELISFFDSVSYRLQLWPDRNPTEEDFYGWGEWTPEPPVADTATAEGEVKGRVDIIDEMLTGQKTFKRRHRL